MMIGTRVGQFVIRRVLGEGGMGTVYLAEHAMLRTPRAVKVLKPALTADERNVQRFVNEARAAASIRHPNIIEVHDVGQLPDGSWFMLLDYLEGQTLAQLLEAARSLAPARIVQLVKEIASGLGAAHEREIVHRDLKPENIFLREGAGGEPGVTLLDFGVAQLGAERAGPLTHAGAVIGTPAFMAPEQLRGARVEPAADVFALGVLVYQMTTGGRFPFQAEATAAAYRALPAAEIYHRQMSGPPIDPRRYAPDASEAWVRAIAAALEVEPARRPISATAFAQLLDDAAFASGWVSESGASGSEVHGSGVHGSGVHGSGVHGSGVHGSGVHGSGVHGSGVHGSGVHGSGVHGSGVSGSGVHGSGVHGSGASGSGASGSGASGRAPARAEQGPRSRYRLGPKLGSGGMAEVFLGTALGAEGFARRVAIKRVLPGRGAEPRAAAMLAEEARIASQLSHPNVAAVLDFDRDAEGRMLLVMELVDGKDLAALTAEERMPPAVVSFVVSEILRGLGYAHALPHAGGARGYVHRDVSPHNVLVSWEGAVKVSDFGIAQALEGAGARPVQGKPSYMSPEQIEGEPLDGRSDLYAVGIMLWELLAGQRLYAGATRETLAQILFREVPRPSEVADGVPADLEQVAMALLARSREDRYATAEAAIEAIARCADAPRDGRSELARWLEARFPVGMRARVQPPREPRASPPLGAVGPRTVDAAASRTSLHAGWQRRRVGARWIGAAVAACATAAGLTAVVATKAAPRARAMAAVPEGVVPEGVVPARAQGSSAPQESEREESAPRESERGSSAPRESERREREAPTAVRPPSRPRIAVPAARPRTRPPPPSTTLAPAPSRPREEGALVVRVRPWAEVWIDGAPAGQTPVRTTVTAGSRTVLLKNDERQKLITVEVAPARETMIDETW